MKQLQRVKVIENAVGGRMSVGEAARLLALSPRQVQRLKRCYQPDSLAWVQHGNRGRPMQFGFSPGEPVTSSVACPVFPGIRPQVISAAASATSKAKYGGSSSIRRTQRDMEPGLLRHHRSA